MKLKDKKQKDRPTPLNPEINVRNFLPRVLKKIWSRLRYGRRVFFDTNFAVVNGKRDKRIKWYFYLFLKIFVTEPVYNEIKDKEQQGFSIIFRKIKLIKHDDLRERYPASCVLYYNFISCVHNPANLTSGLFFAENLLHGGIINGSIDNKLYNRTLNKLSNRTTKYYDFEGNLKQMSEYIDNAFLSRIRKNREVIKKYHNNYFNDYRNFSLMMLYCLLYERNVCFYTSDQDAIANLYIWVESIIQQITFKELIQKRLNKVTKEENIKFYSKDRKRLTFFVDYEEFKMQEDILRNDLLSGDWKKSYFQFKIKFWDIKNNKYFDKFIIRFNNGIRELLLKSHGGFTCPCVKNNDYSNYFGCKYWPLQPNNRYFKIVVRRVGMLIRQDVIVGNVEHNVACLYKQWERENKMEYFCQFDSKHW
jgi:hypothetical protein